MYIYIYLIYLDIYKYEHLDTFSKENLLIKVTGMNPIKYSQIMVGRYFE